MRVQRANCGVSLSVYFINYWCLAIPIVKNILEAAKAQPQQNTFLSGRSKKNLSLRILTTPVDFVFSVSLPYFRKKFKQSPLCTSLVLDIRFNYHL